MTLITLVLTSIPIYFFSFFRVLRQVVDKLVKLQRNFLWGVVYDQTRLPGFNGRRYVCQRKKEDWESKMSLHLIYHCWESGNGICFRIRVRLGQEF